MPPVPTVSADADPAGTPPGWSGDVDRVQLDTALFLLLGDLAAGLRAQRQDDGAFLVTLPGRVRPVPVRLTAGPYGVRVEALVVRAPAQRAAEVYATALARNLRSHTVAFALDRIGDLYLTGVVVPTALTAETVDTVLGQVLAHCDDTLPALLELGFPPADWDKVLADGAGRQASTDQ